MLLATLPSLTHAQDVKQPSSEKQAASDEYSVSVQIASPKNSPDDYRKAQSEVTRSEMQERVARSAPDALRYEPGVSIQQTAHGQASPYVRGLTGQQVLLMFDDVRLNNGTFRQGPNQYFFTVDSLSIESLHVIRGSASTRYGADAMGGAIMASPIEAPMDASAREPRFYPKLYMRGGTQDHELGGRLELGATVDSETAAIGGIGYRHVGQLQAGGVVSNPGFSAPLVPRFEDDGRTQMGTGFSEGSFDLRVARRISRNLRLIGAVYGYRQFDAPRTDQCPPAEAPSDECLWIDKQFRTLSYVSLRAGKLGDLRDTRLTASYQRFDEARRRERPRSFVRHTWNDAVNTMGLSFRTKTRPYALSDVTFIKMRFGAEVMNDILGSEADTLFTDLDRRSSLSRGLYLSGSRYLTLGAFSEVELYATEWLTFYGGARASFIDVHVPFDGPSQSLGIDRNFSALVGRFGADARITEHNSVFLNVDQGFRAPNLDDLSARTMIGPGFQYDNPDLQPERSTTIELGLRNAGRWLKLDAWVFATLLDDAITRLPQDASGCPPETPECTSSRTRFALVNAPDSSVILGSEGAVMVFLPEQVSVRATASYAFGYGPDLDSALGPGNVPLSRIPPVHGTVESRWQIFSTGVYTAAVLHWALAQHRLAPIDLADPRIPPGGTPGYTLVDFRAGWQINDKMSVNMVFENMFDTAYRVHGSSINGPGRGIRGLLTAAW